MTPTPEFPLLDRIESPADLRELDGVDCSSSPMKLRAYSSRR